MEIGFVKNEMDVEEYLCQGDGRDENKDRADEALTCRERVCSVRGK